MMKVMDRLQAKNPIWQRMRAMSAEERAKRTGGTEQGQAAAKPMPSYALGSARTLLGGGGLL
jgi:hypothetical protein